ncbi:MAG: 50S ribosomal protein L11 methyltransferase [Betaproteobacteria bacterium]
MPFRSIRFDTGAAQAERWSDALIEAGALSVDVSDPAAGTADESPVYGEPDGPSAPWWPVSRLEALLPVDCDGEALIAEVASALGEPLPLHEARDIADRDWVRATQSQFGPIAIGESFWIVPTWCDPPVPDAITLRLDPGLAFGTGSHPTTRLCIEWLQASLRGGETVLDYGCGSGILAIAAAKLGAREVTGTDIDRQALVASAANAAANGVAARFVAPDALSPGACDVVVANILAHPLILLAPALAARTNDGGRIALSGILEAQADEVVAAYARWFTLGAWRSRDGWVLLAGARYESVK